MRNIPLLSAVCLTACLLSTPASAQVTYAHSYTVPTHSYPISAATSALETSGQCVLSSFDGQTFNRQSLSDKQITWQSSLYDVAVSVWYTAYGVTHTIVEYKRRNKTGWLLIAYGQYLATQQSVGFFAYTSDDATHMVARCDMNASNWGYWGTYQSNL